MNRSLWAESFSIGEFPRYPCPDCAIREDEGTLAVDAKTFAVQAQSAVFHAFLRCDGCDCAVSVAGFVTDDELFPKSFVPAVPLIRNPSSQGGWTGLLVEKAFELFWVDEASCANCLRSFLEGVLDDWAVPRGRKGQRLSLHDRISYFRDSVDAIEEEDRRLAVPIFQRLKKIGDLGSHAADVSRESLLGAFEDLEIALGLIYGMENEPAVARMKAAIKAALPERRSN